jgi:zinc/manganese transport system substrate-binding protein
MSTGTRRAASLLAVLAAALALAACGAPAPAAGTIGVVAAEDVWGDVAAQLGGRHVSVTSLITDPNADPHEYTANAGDAAAVHAASIVVVNGAGYDPFMGQLLAASGTSPTVLTVAALAHAAGANPNPHLWYDLATVRLVARALAAAYERHDRAHAGFYAARLRAFDGSLAPVALLVTRIRREFAGTRVAYTERVPGYLLTAAGLAVATPPGFARAIESGTEPNLRDTLAMEHLMASHGVAVLLYDTQTVSTVTSAVRTAAVAAGIEVVGVAETLPAHTTYQRWQLDQDRALLSALGG